MHGHPTMQAPSVKSGRCPDGVYGRIIAWLDATRRAESRNPARRPGKALSVPPVFADRVPDVPPLRRPAARSATLAHQPCTTAHRPSALLFPAIPPTGIRLPGEPATTTHGSGNEARCARRSSGPDRLVAPVTRGLREAPPRAAGKMASRAAGTMRCEKLRPAARHSGRATRSPTH